jgi:tetratricopeptide (TPR) repeat protein
MLTVSVQEAMRVAVQFHQEGRLAEAERVYRQVLEQSPRHPDALHLMGVVAHQTGRQPAAIDWVSQAIRVNPLVGDYHNSLGEAYRAAGRLDEAVACYQRAIELRADCAEWHANLGSALLEKGQLDEAISTYRKAIHLKDDIAGVHNNLGYALRQKGLLDEAIAEFRKAIELGPNLVNAHLNLGNALQEKGQFGDAIAAYRRVVEMRGGFAEGYNMLGAALRKNGQFAEAVQAQRRAIQLKPGLPEAHYDLGIALFEEGCLDEAIRACQKAIDLKPDFADAHFNKSWMLLLKGDYEEGWAEHEWRWKRRAAPPMNRNFSQPAWDGSPPLGRTLLLYAEQGLGDTIMFIRYAPLAARRGARVIVECQPELRSLLNGMEGVDQVVARGEAPFDKPFDKLKAPSSVEGLKAPSEVEGLPPFDLQIPLLSLPRIFGTTRESIPAEVPYLRPSLALVEAWREKVAGAGSGLKVGLTWAESRTNKQLLYRSLPLSSLAALGGVKGVRFFSLQRGDVPPARAENPPAGMGLVDLMGEVKDFADMAALIANLDLVISVDTAAAHLAGAMARPVWTLLPFVPDWRWMLDREDSPWYPTMRLFRQRTRGDWAGVVEKVAGELNRRVQGRGLP